MSRYNPTSKKIKELEDEYLQEIKKDKEDFFKSASKIDLKDPSQSKKSPS